MRRKRVPPCSPVSPVVSSNLAAQTAQVRAPPHPDRRRASPKTSRPTNGKGTSSTRADRNGHTAAASAAAGQHSILAANVTTKKPPLNVKHTPSPKERKSAARHASAG